MQIFMEKRTLKLLMIIGLVLLWPYQPVAVGGGKRPFSIEEILDWLKDISPGKVAEVVKQQGVNFEVTEAQKQL